MTARNALTAATLAILFTVLSAATGQRAEAQRKKKKGKPACGITYLPLVEGNEWTYEPVQAPAPKTADEKKFLDGLAKQAPVHPLKIEIKVLSVKKGGDGVTEIKLEEKATLHVKGQEIKIQTKLRCTPKRLEISPDSFFFAAEAGGGLRMELENVEREGDAFPGRKGFRRGKKWTIALKGDLKRSQADGTTAELTNGKVEIEREITVGPKTLLATPTGTYRAISVWFQMSGRANVEPDMKNASEIPLGVNGILWFEPKVGMVQAKNRSGQWFQLTAMKLN